MKKIIYSVATVFITTITANAQLTPAQKLILTNEDSLHSGVNQVKTVLSGYGSASYQRDFNAKTASINLDRAVLFVGHRFNDKISFFSELEIEDAKVGDGGGEVAMEQAYLRFNLNSYQYINAGLFIPRIGIINENHLPTNFNGVERPIVEQIVIPSTWRELGIGFYGASKKLPINYSIALLNGLNSADFEHGTGLREGRAEGRTAPANNLAITAAVQYNYKDFTFQVSGYAGGSNGLNKRESDKLNLNSGVFALPVYLGEASIQWNKNGWSARALGTYINLPDAEAINSAYENNTSESMYGTYAELAYNFLKNNKKGQELSAFTRYEALDLNSSIPSNAIYDGILKQQHVLVGLTYMPIPNVVIKTDVRLMHTGEENPLLVTDPAPDRLPYKQNNSILNIGIGYSF